MAHEEWRDVVGYEGLYQVSNLGRVRSVDRYIGHNKGGKRIWRGRILTPTLNSRYYSVSLCKLGTKSKKNIHRLVAEAFLEPVDGKDYVDHINADKSDNRAENLRWVTCAENNQYAFDMGCHDKEAMSRRSRERIAKNGTPTPPKPVIRNDGVIFESAAAAARAIGTREGNVATVARGEKNTAKGYSFKFLSEPREVIDEFLASHGIDEVKDLPDEQWVDIDGYDGQYLVSNMGRVKSASHFVVENGGKKRLSPARIIGHESSRSGQMRVELKKDDSKIGFMVCDLVARAFLGGWHKYAVVEHINGNEKDDRADNLRISETQFKSGRKGKPVVMDDEVVFNSTAEAAEAIGDYQRNVSAVVRGRRRSCKGHTFKFLDQVPNKERFLC